MPRKTDGYLDSLCKGDNPKLNSYREGRIWHYALREMIPSEGEQNNNL